MTNDQYPTEQMGMRGAKLDNWKLDIGYWVLEIEKRARENIQPIKWREMNMKEHQPYPDIDRIYSAVMEKEYDLENRLIEYAVRIIRISEALPKTKAGRHISNQILRSGTSPAPNYGEAQSAESRDDFVHKLKICHKELRETKVWLKIIGKANLIKPESKMRNVEGETDELIAILYSSIATAKKNKGK